tara:strand:- start:2147 stop:2371 length:225 start_codon:yes stop_codon:yes gene_type:complete
MNDITEGSLRVGNTIFVGHNGAKLFGDELISYSSVRIEAVGADWLVVRTKSGKARSATFEGVLTDREIQEELMS